MVCLVGWQKLVQVFSVLVTVIAACLAARHALHGIPDSSMICLLYTYKFEHTEVKIPLQHQQIPHQSPGPCCQQPVPGMSPMQKASKPSSETAGSG